MKEFTTSHKGEVMGIFIDGALASAPTIEGVIDDVGILSGGFRSLAEAQELAKRLNAPSGTKAAAPTSFESANAKAAVARAGNGASQQTFAALQAACDSGAGYIGILHYPSAWNVVPHSEHYSREVRTATIQGQFARVTISQDDSLSAIDPKTRRRHFIEDTATYIYLFKHTTSGFVYKRHLKVLASKDMIDGAQLMLEN